MARIRPTIVFMAIMVALALTLAPAVVKAVPPAPACPPGQAPAFPGSGDCILDSKEFDQYSLPLVIPPIMDTDGATNSYDIAVRQFQQQILPGGIYNVLGATTQTYPATTVWSYGPDNDPLPDASGLDDGLIPPGVAPALNSQFNYPAYTIQTTANTPVAVRWINDLKTNFGAGPGFLPHLLPIDQTLHWANPPMDCIDGDPRTDCRGRNPAPYMGPVPIVTHVHGAHVEGHSDGYPEAWWLPAAMNIPGSFARSGRLFDDATGTNDGTLGYADYVYRNDQPAATLWYHDHALGMTRNNVYAGPAGFWLVRGGIYDLSSPPLPGPAPQVGDDVFELNVPGNPVRNSIREIPIAIQDRSFKKDGSLFYPRTRAFFEGIATRDLKIPFIPNMTSDISPIWNPEAFFNTIVVNGVVWPKLVVAPAIYRFRFLNGCNSRFLWLKFSNPAVEVYQIGAEQGFLPAPLLMNALNLDQSGDGKAQILMALAERADVLVDFRGLADETEIELLNIGPDEPFGGGIPGTDFNPADSATTGKVMKFVVDTTLADNGGPYGASPTDPVLADGTTNPSPATIPGDLPEEPPLGAASVVRNLSLNEEMSERICVNITFEDDGETVAQIRQITSVRPGPDFEEDCEAAAGEPFGPKAALLGIMEGDNDGDGLTAGDELTPVPLMWTDMTGNSFPVSVTLRNGDDVDVYVTENPVLNDIEHWDIYNLTADAHPIHLHLVRFNVRQRAVLATDGDGEVILPITTTSVLSVRQEEDWEHGYKDTVIAYPGEITRIRAKFDIVGLYVWHCHIVEHEDNEMMRPFVVSPPPANGIQQNGFGFGGL